MDAFRFRDGMNMLEDFVCGFVPASALPPTFNNPFVVPKDFDVSPSGSGWGEGEDEELEADCLCPADVPSISLPTWEEPPSSPPAFDCDPNTSF